MKTRISLERVGAVYQMIARVLGQKINVAERKKNN
jgi:hypothetical protein